MPTRWSFAPPPNCESGLGKVANARAYNQPLTKEEITTAIIALKAKGFAVSPEKMNKNDPTAVAVVCEALGHNTSTSSIYQAGSRRYKTQGKWRGALRAAGLDPEVEYAKRQVFTEADLIKGLKALHEAGRPINSGNIQKDETAKSSAILKDALGIDTTAAALFQGSREYYPKWNAMLERAEFDPKEIRLHARWSKELVVKAIKAAKEASLPLYSNGVRYETRAIFRDAMKKAMGYRASGAALLDRAVHYYGSWDAALRAADIDPGTVRARQWRRAGLSLIPHQVESSDDGSGKVKSQKLIGRAAAAPESVASENELFDRVQALNGKIGGEDGELVNEIVDVILESPEVMGPEAIARALGSRRREPVSSEKVKALLAQVAQMLGSPE